MQIPIFPLNGVILFPKTNLPLNIFEERYIDMIDYSLSSDRLIGMVQHKEKNELYNIGCYGKITMFNEIPNKRYLINLEGINCFKIINEIDSEHKFRICEIEIFDNFNSHKFEDGLKSKMLYSFKKYNNIKNINLNLDDISKLNLDDLLKLIVMVSPFEDSVKQMFLELKSNKELYKNILSTLEIEMASDQESASIN
tara:strand:- start:1221 stop:1811 length:591 start_codon:yes stop_codon:yes gene_type:complete